MLFIYHTIFFTITLNKYYFIISAILFHRFSPEQLWILNPKRILKRLDLDQGKHIKEIELQEKDASQDTAFLSDTASINNKDCWICYDSERQDAGPLIQPCHCRGDVSAVHHDCLRRWLVEVNTMSYLTYRLLSIQCTLS